MYIYIINSIILQKKEEDMAVKYVFVTGGVVSGLGKGITAASLGRLLKARGYKVTMQKFDPYINIDPGTMNPIQHGEVFVTEDGTETDLDLGHYERFIDENLDKNSNVTTGKVYWSVLQKERRGDYGGGTVQVIPHITNEIKSRFYRNFSDKETRIAIIEVGGTVGDIESQPFLESIRQFQHEVGSENAILIHVTLIPYLRASQEMKRAIVVSPVGVRRDSTMAFQSVRSGSGQSRFKHSQATCAKCSFSIVRGASYKYSTSRFCNTWLLGTLQKRAILSFNPGSKGYSLRQTMMSGRIPIP